MAVSAKPGACPHPILVDHAQRAEAHVARVAIIAERETMSAVQPPEIRDSPLFGGPQRDHGQPPKENSCSATGGALALIWGLREPPRVNGCKSKQKSEIPC